MKQLRPIISLCAAVLMAALIVAGCGGSTSATPNAISSAVPTAVAKAQAANTPVDPTIVAADNALGMNLLGKLIPTSGGANVAISPLSVALALQVLYNGAAGSTQQAMAQTLEVTALSTQGLNDDNAALQASLISSDPQVLVTVANSLWINQSAGQVVPGFTLMDQTYYGATVGDLAGAPDNVNAWINNKTQGLIPTLLPPGLYQYAIVANALYFKGQWASAFDPSQTLNGPFTRSDGGQTSAQLMNQTGLFDYAAGSLHGSAFQAVRMPYGAGRFSMLIILPDADTSVSSFVSSITNADLTALAAQLQQSTVALTLPRFTASYGTSLIPALITLGMGAAFESNADFSALAANFQVNVIQHQTAIAVDETGTIAAAATGAGGTAAVVEPAIMSMDHPFFYAVQDDTTGELLFVGVLMDPS